jgi:hypothetical protein
VVANTGLRPRLDIPHPDPYTGAVTRGRSWARALSLAVLLSSVASAEHEVFYRYVVLGYVQDAKRAPLKATRVTLLREKTGFSYTAETDTQGFYIIVARLGDESLGERLTVKTESVATTIVARFDPENHAAHRGTRVDFVGGRSLERPTLFATTLKRFLAQ